MSARKSLLLSYQKKFVEDSSQLKIWLAARQVGKSFALSFEAVKLALTSKCDVLLLSASERQSRELMEKVFSHLRVLRAMTADLQLAERESKTEIKLTTGSRIISLPASPQTVRGFSGHVFLDEFAMHTDDRKIWRAMYPATTRGYKLRVASTPRGKQNMFYEIWAHAGNFSKHKTDIYEAVKAGLKVDLLALKSAMRHDPDGWAQEYECSFVDEATAFVPYEMISACEHEQASVDYRPEALKNPAFVGVDIARKQDLTVIWLVEQVGDVLWTRVVECLHNARFKDQKLAIERWAKVAHRVCIDATGLGMQLAEELQEQFGKYKIEAVTFTNRIKEELATNLRIKLEDRLLRLPINPDIRADFHSVKKIPTKTGVRFDAEHSELGHADRFWACALACYAASDASYEYPIYVATRARREALNIVGGYV